MIEMNLTDDLGAVWKSVHIERFGWFDYKVTNLDDKRAIVLRNDESFISFEGGSEINVAQHLLHRWIHETGRKPESQENPMEVLIRLQDNPSRVTTRPADPLITSGSDEDGAVG